MDEEYREDLLRVDLDHNQVERFPIDKDILRKYLGGTGLGAKFLYDEVLPGTEWSATKNRIIFSAGPLNATSIGGSGSISVVSKGPLTNGIGCSQANGFFGAYLRLCGLYGIIIQGASENYQYLHVDSDSAELLDAEWLRYIDTYMTNHLVKNKHDCSEKEMSVASIGPAGENLVKFAGIFFDHCHSASHNGLGAVMGSKKLKAIAINRARKKIPIYNPNKLRTISKQLVENVKEQSRDTYEYGMLNGLHNNARRYMIPVKNYTTSKWIIDEDKWKKFGGSYIRKNFPGRRNPCWACQIHHCDIIKITKGPYAGMVLEEPDYEQFAAWSSNIDIKDVTSAMMLSKEVDCLGLETNEAGWVTSWVMECFEKGYLKAEDLGGLEVQWGNVEAVKELLTMIANRKGFGDILAEGVKRASEKLGVDGANAAIYTMKGNTPRSHDHRNRTTEQFDTVVSNTSTIETWGGPISLGSYPNWEDIVKANIHDKGAMMFEDSLVTCRFNTRMNMELLSQAVSAVSGWDFSYEEAHQVGQRIVHLIRAFNVRHGLVGKRLEKPSKRYGSKPDAGDGKGKNLNKVWDKMLDRYYEGMGWDFEGKPLKETLIKFGLKDVVNDLKI
jgi:aldehyde:ferredoxin oxidoreductase